MMTRGTHDFGENLEYWPWADNPTPGFDYSACCGKPESLCACHREPEEGDTEQPVELGTVDYSRVVWPENPSPVYDKHGYLIGWRGELVGHPETCCCNDCLADSLHADHSYDPADDPRE